MKSEKPLLQVEGLSTHFILPDRVVKAVDKVDLLVRTGEILCIVGESGSGKTATGLSILRLLPAPGRIVDGAIWFDRENLLTKSNREMERVRGTLITMVFQDPRAALDPYFRIGDQLIDTVRAHRKVSRQHATDEVRDYLQMVKVRNADRLMDSYPHEPSGGECQRAMLAMALLCRPRLLIADEATSSLDAVVQLEILEIIRELRHRLGMAVIFITHDFGVVASIADTVSVMYAGQVVESGPAEQILVDPKHPYTHGLINSVPRIDKDTDRLFQIGGQPPDVAQPIVGCPFAPRCDRRVEPCSSVMPASISLDAERLVRCHLYDARVRAPHTPTLHGETGHG